MKVVVVIMIVVMVIMMMMVMVCVCLCCEKGKCPKESGESILHSPKASPSKINKNLNFSL